MNVPFLFVLVVCAVQSLTEGQPLDGAHGNDIIYNEFVNENIDKGEYSYRYVIFSCCCHLLDNFFTPSVFVS